MAIKKQPSGHWICDIRPWGRSGKRIRKKFTTKGEAAAYEAYIKTEAASKPWNEVVQKDDRKLSELINIWYRSHGITLKTGIEMQGSMLFIADYLGDPLAIDFKAKHYAEYREKRLAGKIFRRDQVQNITLRTINKELKIFKSMFNELKRIGEWSLGNPLENIREFKQKAPEMAYLTKEQIDDLLAACRNSRNKDLLKIVKLALATGARWSEVENIRPAQITKYRVTFIKTKNGNERTVPISESLYDEVTKDILPTSNKVFSNCYKTFGRAIDRADIQLPKGQLSHVLRHTFGSHFMMNGGNILVLQKILGHTNIQTTMRYAHFAPDHLKEAIQLNPLDNPAELK